MAGAKDAYADLADVYDSRSSDSSIQAFYHERRESLLKALRRYKIKGRVLVDLACGTGNATVPWSRRRGWPVIGVDRSAAMLRQAPRARRGKLSDKRSLNHSGRKKKLVSLLDRHPLEPG